MWLLLTMMAYADGNCLTAQCENPAPPPVDAVSVLNRPLQSCSTSPMTGWYRDSYCRTDDRDRGVHVVCATMTDDFLTYTKAQGNDLSTPSPRSSFPGLKAGDHWCLCASRWLHAPIRLRPDARFGSDAREGAWHHSKSSSLRALNIIELA